MSKGDIVDRFMELKYPERYKEVQESIATTTSQLRNGRTDDELKDAFRSYKRSLLEEYNPDIINAVGWSIDDLIEAAEAKASRKRGGREGGTGQSYNKEKLEIALHSFIDSEKKCHSFSEAIKQAQNKIAEEHRTTPDTKTIRSWLHTLVEWKVTSIEPPKRGRPIKGE